MSRISNAEIKAGIFLTFCLALFVAMLFGLGRYGHSWHARQEIRVVFSQVGGLRTDAAVLYNGLDIGHVKRVEIVRAGVNFLKKFPPITKHNLENLPIDDAERERLRKIPDEELDEQARGTVEGRTMVLLTLDVLGENDAQRFRSDDEYSILGSMMGDSCVQIKTGSDAVVPPASDRVFLGVSGDMYTDLEKSICEVKDILGSMADLVGGDKGKQIIQGHLNSFDMLTSKLENMSESIGAKTGNLWGSVDERIAVSKNTLDDLDHRLATLRPKLEETLLNTQKSVEEIRKNAAQSLDNAREKLAGIHKDSDKALKGWEHTIAGYKEKLPAQTHLGREWSERFVPTVDKVDHFFTRADDQLNKGLESTLSMLEGYIAAGAGFEESTYRLRKWPWTFAHKPEPEAAAAQTLSWKHELMRRQYLELREELERIHQGLAPASLTDKGRAARIQEIMRESDADLNQYGTKGKP